MRTEELNTETFAKENSTEEREFPAQETGKDLPKDPLTDSRKETTGSAAGEEIRVSYSHTYDIRFIVDPSPDYGRIGELDLESYERLFVIIDRNIRRLYGQTLLRKLPEMETFVHEVEAVEYAKSIDYYPVLVDFLEEHTAGRYDAVLVIGGGILLDLVSFTVSTYMRGLPLFMIPTTLIGETDASTAGKTCLNAHNTKNLLGTFYYPKTVYNSIEIMKGSPKRITRQGLSEAFKYSLLTDGKLLPEIIRFQNAPYDAAVMENIVCSTIRARIAVRQVDPLASNLGHTFGHALEKYSGYRVLHGDAILTGTVMAIHYAVEKGLMDSEERDRILDMMRRARLNVWVPEDLDVHRLVEFMRKDKKSSSRRLHLVMIRGIGRPYRGETPFYEAEYGDVEEFLIRYAENCPYRKADYYEFLSGETLQD